MQKSQKLQKDTLPPTVKHDRVYHLWEISIMNDIFWSLKGAQWIMYLPIIYAQNSRQFIKFLPYLVKMPELREMLLFTLWISYYWIRICLNECYWSGEWNKQNDVNYLTESALKTFTSFLSFKESYQKLSEIHPRINLSYH